MKRAFFIFNFLVSSLACFCQVTNTYVYDGQGNLISGTHIRMKRGVEAILKDSTTGNIFVLDTSHINLYAITPKGDTLWKADPWKDNHLMEYRVKRPFIVDFDFAKNERTKNKEVIWIVYINTQFGIIDKTTGKFTWFGQD